MFKSNIDSRNILFFNIDQESYAEMWYLNLKQPSDRNLVIHNYLSSVQLLLRIQTLEWLFKMSLVFIVCFLLFLMLVLIVLSLLYIIDLIQQLRRENRLPRRIVRASDSWILVTLKLVAKIVKNFERSVRNLWSVMRKSLKCNEEICEV